MVSRKAEVSRKTKETDISLELDLDGENPLDFTHCRHEITVTEAKSKKK